MIHQNELNQNIEKLETDLKILNQLNKTFFSKNSSGYEYQVFERVNNRVNTEFDRIKTGLKSSLKRQASLEFTTKKLLIARVFKKEKQSTDSWFLK